MGYENGFEWEGYVFKQDNWFQLDNLKCIEMFKLEAEIEKLNAAKTEALNKQEFEMYASLRDRFQMLQGELDSLK